MKRICPIWDIYNCLGMRAMPQLNEFYSSFSQCFLPSLLRKHIQLREVKSFISFQLVLHVQSEFTWTRTHIVQSALFRLAACSR